MIAFECIRVDLDDYESESENPEHKNYKPSLNILIFFSFVFYQAEFIIGYAVWLVIISFAHMGCDLLLEESAESKLAYMCTDLDMCCAPI